MNDKGNIIIYQTKDGQTLIDVRLEMKRYGLIANKWLNCLTVM